MRIIGGQLRGRAIKAPKGVGVRPTQDRVREAIFNRLEHRLWEVGGVNGKRVLDLFAGTGALGIEALSRGAEHVVFVERDRRVGRLLLENLKMVGLGEKALCLFEDLVSKRDAWQKIARHGPFDIILADPPYGLRLTTFVVEMVEEYRLLCPRGVLVVEEGVNTGGKKRENGRRTPRLMELEERRYGDTVVRMWERTK